VITKSLRKILGGRKNGGVIYEDNSEEQCLSGVCGI
jgi:hypothetical protein